MIPTTALPTSPFLNATSTGALVVLIALGAAVTLVASFVLERRAAADPTIDVLHDDGAAEPSRRRVNG